MRVNKLELRGVLFPAKHPKTLLRERGFRLGFVHHSPRPGGVGFVPVSIDCVPLDYCEGPWGVAHAALRCGKELPHHCRWTLPAQADGTTKTGEPDIRDDCFDTGIDESLKQVLVASPRLLAGVAAVMQGQMPTFTRVLEQHENGEQAPLKGVAGLFIVT